MQAGIMRCWNSVVECEKRNCYLGEEEVIT